MALLPDGGRRRLTPLQRNRLWLGLAQSGGFGPRMFTEAPIIPPATGTGGWTTTINPNPYVASAVADVGLPPPPPPIGPSTPAPTTTTTPSPSPAATQVPFGGGVTTAASPTVRQRSPWDFAGAVAERIAARTPELTASRLAPTMRLIQALGSMAPGAQVLPQAGGTLIGTTRYTVQAPTTAGELRSNLISSLAKTLSSAAQSYGRLSELNARLLARNPEVRQRILQAYQANPKLARKFFSATTPKTENYVNQVLQKIL